MLYYRKIVGGPLYSNSYIVYKGSEGFLVDAGVEPLKIYKTMDELNVNIEFIIITHGHFDHVYYAQELSGKLNVDVYMHEADLEIMRYSATFGEYLYGEPFKEPQNLVKIGDIEKISFENTKIKVIHTPGHSPGSICAMIDNLLFTGDTLLRGAVGRTDLPGGSNEMLVSSLRKIASLPRNYVVLPGHGEETTLKRELDNNLYLKKLISKH